MSELVATSQQGLVGKYQPYQEYKDSGVEWLGNVPSHWTVTAVKRFSSFTTGWTPPTGNDAYFGGEHLWANISDIGHRVLSTTAKTITDAGVRATRIKKSPKGSLLFSFKLSIGLVSIVGEDMYTNEAIATFLPSETFNISYMYWAAPLFIPQNAEENIYGAKLLNQERIGNASFVLPTPKEQRTIAAFLDYETARIDRLIAQQQRLIELLKEKRQAVISHAVTKGLNPNVPMRDSGIEWLGQVPKHWDVSRLKFESDVIDCRNKTPEYFDNGEYFVVRTTNVKNQQLNFNNALYTDKNNFEIWTQRGIPVAGSILFTREAPTGEVCIVPENVKLCMGQRMMNFICSRENYTNYLFDYLMSACLERYINSVSHGSTVSHLRVEQVENIPVLVPPEEELVAIHEHIRILKKQYDILEEKVLKAIELMQERRTALISAAVTGKIDLRGWTPPAEEVAA